MNISIITLFPELYRSFLDTSLMKRAKEQGKVHYELNSLFSYVAPKERIDDTTFGHSSGMLIRPDVIEKSIDDVEAKFGKAFKIFLSPQGKKLNQTYAKQLWEKIVQAPHLLLLASRYEGIDARVESYYADELVSVGDFVTMGGDIPAMLLLECLLRFMPGVVGKQESVELDSFSGAFIDHPEYTKPVVWKGLEVPAVLRSGNHQAIHDWRREKSAEKTVKHHFGWLRSVELSKDDKKKAKQYIPYHYIALLHSEVLLKEGKEGTTSVTSIDIHDIARSSATYGLKQFFIVTPLEDQQKIVQIMLDFWHAKEIGGAYNRYRHEAVSRVVLKSKLQEVIDAIEVQEGKKPIVIGTSARLEAKSTLLHYDQQELVWEQERPVLFLLGTGHGISDSLLQRCDYILQPVYGFEEFNHLSVRSAAAIIFDRWLGISPRSCL